MTANIALSMKLPRKADFEKALIQQYAKAHAPCPMLLDQHTEGFLTTDAVAALTGVSRCQLVLLGHDILEHLR